jgi:hypothetical protein
MTVIKVKKYKLKSTVKDDKHFDDHMLKTYRPIDDSKHVKILFHLVQIDQNMAATRTIY